VRASRLVIVGVVIAVLAAAGAVYLATPSSSISHHTGTTPTAIVVPDVLHSPTSTEMPDARDLAALLDRRVTDPALGPTSAFVVDADTDIELYSRNADTAMAPASTAKLLTAAAALTQLRPTDTLTTGVVRSGNTLYLVGGGDLTLAARRQNGYPPTATLAELASRTVAAVGDGTRLRLRYDAGGWSGPVLAHGWSASYLAAGNISRLSPLELDEGRLSQATTAPRALDPARQAVTAFRRALHAAGLDVRGPLLPAAAPASGLGIAAVESAPVPALVQRMLTDSDNDLAEALGRMVARHSGKPATFTGAATAVAAAVRHLGVAAKGLKLYDASGLSRDDRVSTRTLVGLLVRAEHLRALAPLLAGLPVAGFTGTLADRYRRGASQAGAGVVRAKTGTLAGVNALAGQVVDTDGRLIVFALLTDHVPLPTPAERALDRLAATLARCGCRAAT
jgi:D-alanyl-D-alanine carboxypeptidase/D-alanyl-D-alanine-endopeptidase (penicillin-binding protein 4)